MLPGSEITILILKSSPIFILDFYAIICKGLESDLNLLYENYDYAIA